ncbi:hypothetical protein ACFQFH_15955 [Halobaculum halobium]|uniref:HNH endonuclease n=1 Tax=Halobaculum halobium TaxID=3032281 RepID=A0ABD5TII0_9EURY|nr:hypothetical protein [Halobaculum sp. SYNS20]
MERTPDGSPVGVDNPYEFAGRCDHLTSDGRCRFALERAGDDPDFAAGRRRADYACVAAAEDADWRDCPHYRSTTDAKECVRCGLEEVRIAHDERRPLVEEHHLSYGGGASIADGAREPGDGEPDRSPSHEITVGLCRWCHTKVHRSFARVDDDASPDPEAVAERESRRSDELGELGFSSASERYGDE